MAETYETRITVKAPPERVFEAFVKVGDLLNWFCDAAVIGKREGGNWALGWYADEEGDAGYHMLGRIESYAPPRELIVRDLTFSTPEGEALGPMRLSMHFAEETPEATAVRILQEGISDEPGWDAYRAGLGPGWERSLEYLKGWLEEGKKLPGR
ncbi:MAG: SRPBCC domain-containing protein [Acidobacteria bacterium]|nr:SRPBCC domain-containing protein [Acidobacteriota bacterium]MCG3194998.1 hypothetical protein [Thermoanaerobaculia bacterium]MCK6685090.1 SRPBCC domain-containing protein [Thermoanaerobaculia bacterium]